MRVLIETKVLEEAYEQLALIDEKRARAQRYQKRIARAFNKKVKRRDFKEGNLVLKVFRDKTFDPREKMKPRWSRPFIIKKIMSKCAICWKIWFCISYKHTAEATKMDLFHS